MNSARNFVSAALLFEVLVLGGCGNHGPSPKRVVATPVSASAIGNRPDPTKDPTNSMNEIMARIPPRPKPTFVDRRGVQMFEMLESARYNVRKTSSLVTPFTGEISCNLRQGQSEGEAMSGPSYPIQILFEWRDDRWIIKDVVTAGSWSNSPGMPLLGQGSDMETTLGVLFDGLSQEHSQSGAF